MCWYDWLGDETVIYVHLWSQRSSGYNASDCSVSESRFESHRWQSCLSRRPLRYKALVMGYALTVVPRSTQLGFLSLWVTKSSTASAAVTAGMSPVPSVSVSSRSGEAGLHYPCEPLYRVYLLTFCASDRILELAVVGIDVKSRVDGRRAMERSHSAKQWSGCSRRRRLNSSRDLRVATGIKLRA